jgi:hypothetical protein
MATSSSEPKKLRIKELNLDSIPPNNKTMYEKDQGGAKIVIIGKPGCFAPGTNVLMYDGTIKAVEDIMVGEQVMGDDSTPRTVLELCHNSEEMYRIVPKRGEEYVVNRMHKLVLKSLGYHKIKKGDILEISVDEYLKKTKGWQDRWAIYRTGVDFPEQKIDIEPYMLGLWLGDGTSATSEITTVDGEIIDYLKDYCQRYNMVLTNKTAITYRIKSIDGKKDAFRLANLLNNKHIPHEYKVNSRNNRLELLAGLMDTDGSYNDRGHCFDFVQKSEILSTDVVYLARSLGFTASISSCIHKGEKKEGNYCRITISGDIDQIPCKIIRKQARPRISNRNHLISRFELINQGEGEYYGFTLDGNHRFLLGTFDVVRNTGKTTLITSILYHKRSIFPTAMVMSGTEDSNGFYKTLFPTTFVYNKYDESCIESFIRRQKIAKKHLENPWSVILLDDCTDDPSLFRKPLMQGMYKNGRHWKMLFILSLQYCMDVRPVIRTNVDGTFILRETNLKNRRSLHENYAGVIHDFSQFCDIMDQLTDDYTALYIDNQVRSNDITECVFYYKATPVPDGFKFGCQDYWDHCHARYNPEYVDPF